MITKREQWLVDALDKGELTVNDIDYRLEYNDTDECKDCDVNRMGHCSRRALTVCNEGFILKLK